MSELSNYHEFLIPINESNKDICIAWLDFFGAEVILETPETLKAYFNQEEIDIPALSELAEKLKIPAQEIKQAVVKNENWNLKWESNFEPVEVENICLIRASFHKPQDGFQYEIMITPKMAFGTGHHETTYMMILQMSKMNLENQAVLDYGCGTGILSVFAAMLGSKDIAAIDIEEPSFQNTLEHIELNKLDENNFHVACGDLDVLIAGKKYDVVLANINRTVLLSKPEALHELMNNDGFLFISGILKQDKTLVVDAYKSAGYHLLEIIDKGEWLCLKFQKSNNS